MINNSHDEFTQIPIYTNFDAMPSNVLSFYLIILIELL